MIAEPTRTSGWTAGSPLTALLAALVLLVAPAGQAASPAASAFQEANRLYEEGHYPEAVTAYQAILRGGVASPALYFNLGNACFKSGQIGRAIVNYRSALRLAPRDPDIRANLNFARNSVYGSAPPGGSWWARGLGRLSLDEWTGLAAAGLWIWFGLLIAGQLNPGLRRPLRALRRVACLACLTLMAGLMLGWQQDRLERTAIVVKAEAVVRYGPLEESRSYFTVRDGAELTVQDTQGDWVQVSDGSRRTGWLKKEDVVVFPTAAAAAG